MASQKVTVEMMIAYAAGELDAAEAARVEAHLAQTPADAAKVARMQELIATMRADDTVAPPADVLARAKAIFQPVDVPAWRQWLEGLREVAARLVFDSRSQPALEGYRGAAEAVQLSYETDVADIDLELSPGGGEPAGDGGPADQEAAGGPTLMGHVSLHEGSPPVEVVLVPDGDPRHAIAGRSDEHGTFALGAPAGRYELLIRAGNRIVRIPEIIVE